MGVVLKEKSKIEFLLKKIIIIGLCLEFIGTLLIFVTFTDIYEKLNIIIAGLMILDAIIFILSIIFLKYNKKSALGYLILCLIFFFFSDKSRYSLIFVIILSLQGKGMY